MADWYKMHFNDKRSLPGSQGKAILLLQSEYVPLQAALALTTGRYAANLASFKEYLNAEKMICEVCCHELDRGGNGHDKQNCSIHKRAVEVLTDKSNPEARAIEARQQLLSREMNENAERLANLVENK